MSPQHRGSDSLSRAAARPEQYRRVNRIFYITVESETGYDYFDRIYQKYGQEHRFVIRTPPASVKRNGLKPPEVVTEVNAIIRDHDIAEAWGLFDHDGRENIDQVCARAKRLVRL